MEGILIPSEERVQPLNLLDLEEFLWALGDEVTMPVIVERFVARKPLVVLHEKVMLQFRRYMITSGTPQSVIAYLDIKEFKSSEEEERGIIELYRKDVGKFAGSNAEKVRLTIDMIPSQMNKKEKRFSITSLGEDARNRDYKSAFMWLDDGRIISRCFYISDLSVNLTMFIENPYHKCNMSDTGFLVTPSMDTRLTNKEFPSLLLDKLDVSEGMLKENMVAQSFHASGHRLFFYYRHDRSITRTTC